MGSAMQTSNISGSGELEHCLVPSASVAYPVMIVNGVGSLFGTFANVLVWAAVLRNSQLQTLTNYFLLSLALADMLVTGITQPLFVLRNILMMQDQCENAFRTAYSLAAYFSCMASILNLTAVSIDRLISLKYPLQKRTILPKRRGFAIILGTWTLALVYTTVSHFSKDSTVWVTTTFVYFVLCYFTMILTHSHMYVVSHRFVKRQNQARRNSFSMIAYTKERQAAKTIAVIIAVLSLAWLPYGCGIAISAACKDTLSQTLSYPLLTLGLLNSSINPLLYSWRNKEFRTTFWQLLKCQDPNLMRRESVSSFYIRRSRVSTASSVYNDCNVQCQTKEKDDPKSNVNNACFIVGRHFTL